MKLANAPVSWGVSEATGGSQPLAATVLDEIAECGYTGTELGPYGFLATEPAELHAALAARGLALAGAYCPLTLHDPGSRSAALAEAGVIIALLAAAGAEVLVLADAGDATRRAIAGRVPRDAGGFDDEQWTHFAEGTDAVARLARDHGLVTAFHPHAATYIETEAEIDELLRRTDPELVGLCLDTGHVMYGGGDPAVLAKRHASRIRHVHLKDVRMDVLAEARSGGFDFAAAVGRGVFAPLGAGDAPIGAVLDALLGQGYDGWLVVEQDRVNPVSGAADAPRVDASRSLAYLRARG